jgi:hypothetical protein
VDPVPQLGAQPDQADPVPQQRAELADLRRRDPGFGQQVGAQQLRQDRRVDFVFSELAFRHDAMLFVGFMAETGAGWRASRPLW